eukprot:gene3624-6440_t
MTTKRRESVLNKMAKMVTPLPELMDKGLNSPKGKRSPRDNEIHQEDLKITAVEILKTSKKAGYLSKQGGKIKAWKRRFFVLQDNLLFYFDDENSKEANGIILLNIPKCASRGDSEAKEKNVIRVVTPHRIFYLAAESEFLAESWIPILNSSVILDNSNQITDARMTGWVVKKSKKVDNFNLKPRFLSIYKNCLYMFRSDEDYVYKREYNLSGANIQRLDQAFNGVQTLQVTDTNNQNIVFQSEDDDINIWEFVLKEIAALSDATSSGSKKNGLKGWLNVDTHLKKGYKQFFVMVNGTSLVLFANDKTNKPEESMDLRGRFVLKVVGKQNEFKIESASDAFFFQTQSPEECDLWTETLKGISRLNIQNLNKEGWMTKQGGSIKSWKKRYCVLKNTDLYYYADPSDPHPKGSISLCGIQIRAMTPQEAKDEVDKKFVLKILQSSRTWFLAVESQQDLIEWSVVLRKAALVFPTDAKILHVDSYPRKKDGYYRTIGDALANAKNLDKIFIHHGEYHEDIFCKKSVHIEAIEPDVTIIATKRPCFMVSCPGGTIFMKGIKFLQQGTGDVDGVSLKKGNLHLENCVIEARGANCVSVISDCHLSLTGCKIQNGKQYGVNVCEDSSCLLENNIVANNGWDGIMVMGNSEAVIRGTSIMQNGYNGVSISTQRRVNIEHSHISDSIWDGITIKNPKAQCVLYNNKVYGNKGFGIYFEIPLSKGKKKKPESDFSNLMDCENTIYENKKGSRNYEQ